MTPADGSAPGALGRHQITRVRRETRRRRLTVVDARYLSRSMRRVEFWSEDLHDFDSASPDDHVKLFFASADGTVMRDFTPRLFDPAACTLAIDFALHDRGPATEWARSAKPGDILEIGGPRGSTIVPDDFDWYLLMGDASALPAICRRLEELRADVTVHCILLVDSVDDQVEVATATNLTVDWVVRDRTSQGDVSAMQAFLDRWIQPEGDGFVFIAAENLVVQALKDAVLSSGHNPNWVKASGYWTAS